MFSCPICKNNFSDGVRCSKCSLSYCFSCANITESNFRKLGAARQATMQCTTCKTNQGQLSPAVLYPGSSSTATLDQVLQELRNGISGINTRLEQLPPIVQELQNLKENLQNFEISMCGMKNEVNENSLKIGEVLKRVESLESQSSSNTDYPQLKMDIAKLSSDLNNKEQLLRINNIEIKGIPSKKKENLIELVCKIGEIIGQTISKTDINFSIRAQSTSEHKNIIIGFLGRYTKENFIAAARARKNGLTAEDLGFAGNTNRVYINDHLTRDNKHLLSKVKKLAQEKNHNHVWVQNCRILTRKNDTSPIIAVCSESDLLKLK